MKSQPTTLTLGRFNSRRGIFLVVFAIAIGPLMALAGLVLDGGMLYFEKRRMQAAADAGAFAGAHEVQRGNDTMWRDAAWTDAAMNRYDNNASDVTVTVNRPPLSGPNTGNNRAVEVIIEKSVPTTFMRVVSRNSSVVRARAVASVEADFNPPCILALNPKASGAITVSGTADIVATDCTIIANSDSPQAITTNGGINLVADAIGYGNLDGGFNQNGSGTISPTPVPAPIQADPFKDCVEPIPGAQVLRSGSQLQIGGGTTPLLPGYYQGGIKITGGDVTFAAGLYVVDGFAANGGTLTSLPGGITIFNTGAGLNDNISIGGNTSATLVAPISPDTCGNFLFWNSKNATVSNGNGGNADGTVIGTSDSTFEGVFYFPTVQLTYGGNAGTQAPFSMIVADTLKFAGTPNLGVNWRGTGRFPPSQQISMLE